MRGVFSDNQTKQKHLIAITVQRRIGFFQGKKLKALKLLDDASTDSFANLFQQVMAKNRGY